MLDKNPDQVVEAKRRFLEIRAAYEVLSDSRERSWYDAHRDVMLKKGSGADYQDDTINVFPFFTSSCYQAFNDSETVSALSEILLDRRLSVRQGFYTVYNKLFHDIAEQDRKGSSDKSIEIPEFGDSESDYEQVGHHAKRLNYKYVSFGFETTRSLARSMRIGLATVR